MVCMVQVDYESFSRDLEAIRLMDDDPEMVQKPENGQDDSIEALSILGTRGYSLDERLSCYEGTESPSQEVVERRISYWVVQSEVASSSEKRQVALQIVERLQQAADVLATL